MQRRRLSLFARRQLQAAYDCLQQSAASEEEIPSVFASRHGEVSQSLRLLAQIRVAEPPSPQGFALSVHNSVAGLWSLLRRDRAPSISIAAGAETLHAALTEARMRLGTCPGGRLLLVVGDEPLPESYRAWSEEGVRSHALAILLHRDAGALFPSADAWRASSCPVSALADQLRRLAGSKD
jgi:hypothetical protein